MTFQINSLLVFLNKNYYPPRTSVDTGRAFLAEVLYDLFAGWPAGQADVLR